MTLMDYVDHSKVQLDDVLSTTGFTIKHILEKLYKNNPEFVKKLGGGARVVKISAYDISKDKGYCSRIFKTTIEFDKHDRDLTFMLKVPTTDIWDEFNLDFTEAQRELNNQNICDMHNAECDSYELLSKFKDSPTPDVYYFERRNTESPGMIMMEDLSQNCVTLGLFFSVSQEHCFNLAKHMADFQTYIDFLPGKPWKGKFTNNVQTKPDPEGLLRKMLQPLIDSKDEPELTKKIEIFAEINAEKLGKYVLEERPAEIGCSTLVHGDMWVNNILVRSNNDKSISNEIVAIIDWQTMFEGNPLFDIVRFVTHCADAEIRRDCKLVDFYYDYLTKKYAEHGEKPKFTREEAHELYELALIQQGIVCTVMYSAIGYPLLKSENGAERAKGKKLALRLNLLLEDALEIMKKRGLTDKFKFENGVAV